MKPSENRIAALKFAEFPFRVSPSIEYVLMFFWAKFVNFMAQLPQTAPTIYYTL